MFLLNFQLILGHGGHTSTINSHYLPPTETRIYSARHGHFNVAAARSHRGKVTNRTILRAQKLRALGIYARARTNVRRRAYCPDKFLETCCPLFLLWKSFFPAGLTTMPFQRWEKMHIQDEIVKYITYRFKLKIIKLFVCEDCVFISKLISSCNIKE